MDVESVKALIKAETEAIEQKYKEELAQTKAQYEVKTALLAKQVARAGAVNLPQCLEPADIHKHAGLHSQHKFVADQRTMAAKLEVSLSHFDSSDDEDMKQLKGLVKTMIKKQDIRLSGIRAAVGARTTRKGEMVTKYEETILPKVNKTTGKYASGEKSFAEVQNDIADAIDEKLCKQEEEFKRSRSFGGRGRGRAERGRGGQGRGGQGRGGQGHGQGRGQGRGDE